MRRHLSYANVMATLATFIALGGTSYAALKVTGKDVRNGSLTGADIKKRSVGLDRLKTGLPRGPAGRVGPAGPVGSAGPAGSAGAKGDPGTPAPPEGVTSLTVGPGQWVSGDARLTPEYSAQRVEFQSTTASGSGFMMLHPQLPAVTGAGRTRVFAVRVCLNAQSSSTLETLFISHFRQTEFVAPSVGELQDPVLDQGPACTRYVLPAPFVMEKDDYLNVRFRASWTAVTARIRVASTTIEYDRVA